MYKIAIFAAVLASSQIVTPSGDPWSWVRNDAINGNWKTQGGVSSINIAGTNITGNLDGLNNSKDHIYKIDGTLSYPLKVCAGKDVCTLSVKVKVMAYGSDYTGSTFKGTYKIINYSIKDRETYGVNSAEYIVLNDTVNSLNFTRIVRNK